MSKRFENINNSLYSFGLNLGPWLAPLSAALIFGAAFAAVARPVLGPFAWLAGGLAALALELAGILFFHISIMNLRRGRMLPGLVAGGLGSAGYLLVGALVVSAIDGGAFGGLAYIPYILVVGLNLARALGFDLAAYENEGIAQTMALASEAQAQVRHAQALEILWAQDRAALAIAKEESNKAARLARIKSKAGQGPVRGRNGPQWAAMGQSGAGLNLNENEKAALEFVLKQEGKATGGEVAQALGLSDRTGRKIITRLKEKGALNGHAD